MVDFSAPYNALIAGNMAGANQNPLATAGQLAQTQTAFSNSRTAAAQANDAELQNAQNHISARIQAITPYIAKGDAVTGNDVLNGLSDLVSTSKGAFSAEEAAHFFTGQLPPAPNNDLGAPSPAMAAALKQHQLRLMSAMDQIATQRGQNADFDTGNGMNFGNRDARTGVRTPQGGPNGFVPAQTSPAQRIAPATVVDAEGNTTQTTLGQRTAAAGVDPVSGMPFQNAIKRPGGGLGTPMPSAGPAGGGDGSGGQPAVGGIPAPGPSFATGLDALNKDRLAASDTMQGLQPLLKALPLAQALGATGSGPGTKPFNDAKAFLISQGVMKPDASVDVRNELDKYLSQAVAKSPLSGRSDMGSIIAQASNPNTTSQTNAATVGLIKNAIVQSRMPAAASLSFADNPSNYPVHKGSFIQKQDQSAYGLDLEPDGGRAIVQKMAALPVNSPARNRFFESLKAAKLAGVGAGQQ